MTAPHPGLGLRVVASGATDLVLTRTFDASATLVFAAFTEPELLRRWHGARGWWLTTCEVDLRDDGAWRFVSSGPDGATMEMYGRFREVVPPVRLVQTETHRGWDDGDALITTVLAETGGQTVMTVTARYASAKIRDQVVRGPMSRGAAEAYERLAAVLAQPSSSLRPERDRP